MATPFYWATAMSNTYSVDDPGLSIDPNFTTVMLRNIPNKYTTKMLLEVLDKRFAKQYDYVYLPVDFVNLCNVGYAFLNLKTPEARARFYRHFHNQKVKEVLPGFNSKKVLKQVCEVNKAKVQGAKENIRRIRQMNMLMQRLKDHPDWVPLQFDQNGTPIPLDLDNTQSSSTGSNTSTQTNNNFNNNFHGSNHNGHNNQSQISLQTSSNTNNSNHNGYNINTKSQIHNIPPVPVSNALHQQAHLAGHGGKGHHHHMNQNQTHGHGHGHHNGHNNHNNNLTGSVSNSNINNSQVNSVNAHNQTLNQMHQHQQVALSQQIQAAAVQAQAAQHQSYVAANSPMFAQNPLGSPFGWDGNSLAYPLHSPLNFPHAAYTDPYMQQQISHHMALHQQAQAAYSVAVASATAAASAAAQQQAQQQCHHNNSQQVQSMQAVNQSGANNINSVQNTTVANTNSNGTTTAANGTTQAAVDNNITSNVHQNATNTMPGSANINNPMSTVPSSLNTNSTAISGTTSHTHSVATSPAEYPGCTGSGSTTVGSGSTTVGCGVADGLCNSSSNSTVSVMNEWMNLGKENNPWNLSQLPAGAPGLQQCQQQAGIANGTKPHVPPPTTKPYWDIYTGYQFQ